MKKTFLLLGSLLILAGAGCTNHKNNLPPDPAPTSSTTTTLPTETDTNAAPLSIEDRLKNLNKNFLENQTIPSLTQLHGEEFDPNFPSGYYNLTEPKNTDCVAVYSKYTSGGDLLSSLEKNQTMRSLVPLQKFSPEYITEIKTKVNQYTINQYQKNLFAFYVCNLQDGIDLVAGHLWLNTKTPYYIQDDYIQVANELSDSPLENQVLLLINKNKVHELKNVQNFTNTATGDETEPCDAKLNSNNILEWRCFAELEESEDNMIYEKYNNWLIGLNGEIIKTWQTKN